MEQKKIFQELEQLKKEMENIQNTLGSEKAIYTLIEEELLEIKQKFARPRRTLIVAGEDDDVQDKDLIAKEDVLVVLNSDGGIKQISLEEYRLQKRGGTGLKGSAPTGDAYVWKSLCVNTHSVLLALTDRGRLYWLDAFRVPRVSRTSKASSIKNLLNLSADESVQVLIPVDSFSKEGAHLCLITRKGVFKKIGFKFFFPAAKKRSYRYWHRPGRSTSLCLCELSGRRHFYFNTKKALLSALDPGM